MSNAALTYCQPSEAFWRIQSSRELLDTALDLHRRDSISWWDSLIVSAAIQGGCDRILSEDSQHGRGIRGVEVLNSFRTGKSKRV